MNKASSKRVLYLSLASIFAIVSCNTIDVFEKNEAIPGQAWSGRFKPEFTFDINDTTARYNIYIVIRHTDAYKYKNMWLNLSIQAPGGITKNHSVELKLATDDKGWLGSGMDDIFEHRVLVNTAGPEPLIAGRYHFTLENIMRDDPLDHVMDIGIRLEKVK